MKKIISILLIVITLLSMSSCTVKKLEVKPELKQMRAICELATLECYYHNVAKFYEEGKNWWDKDKHFWIEYDGVVKIGVDVSLITISIDENDIVTITIPEAKVLDCTVNSDSLSDASYIVDVKSAKITADDETNAMTQAKTKMLETAKADNALLISAQERAKELLENYVNNIGDSVGKQYTIVWKEASDTPSNTTETTEKSESITN